MPSWSGRVRMAWPRPSLSRKRAGASASSKRSPLWEAALARAHSRCQTLSMIAVRRFIRLALASPFLRTLPLQHARLGRGSIPRFHSPIPWTTAGLFCSTDPWKKPAPDSVATGPPIKSLMQPLVDQWEALLDEFLQPLLRLPETSAARRTFRPARAAFGGLGRHKILPRRRSARVVRRAGCTLLSSTARPGLGCLRARARDARS